ncbi:hypothetical protein F3J27_09265 [Enterobacter sp. Ap-916]|uniref:hypothetical protein n=1 Tax=unclassified Enterobacter TaxID=2608935 RepID=UPI00142228A0|nr:MULTISPECIES: hypothetical protein [unclassified Enterobacter]NIF58914.1 hypothetical protein [Enterobacter sp. Ap-867]NIG29670.1 hypothetical protein [Enterobacter sp. Ap-916]
MLTIKWLHRLLTAVLLMVVIGYAWMNFSPSNPIHPLKRTYQVNHNTWLYMTEQSSGGTTVPVAWRYYLSNQLSGDDSDLARQLSTAIPIVVGYGTITDIQVDDKNVISVTYSGKVLSLSDDVTQVRFKIQPH